MGRIPVGKFQMGSQKGESNEKPVHTVYVDAFYIDAHEVTNAQFKKFIDKNPQWGKADIDGKYHNGYYLKYWNGNNYPSGKANHPVVYVSWVPPKGGSALGIRPCAGDGSVVLVE